MSPSSQQASSECSPRLRLLLSLYLLLHCQHPSGHSTARHTAQSSAAEGQPWLTQLTSPPSTLPGTSTQSIASFLYNFPHLHFMNGQWFNNKKCPHLQNNGKISARYFSITRMPESSIAYALRRGRRKLVVVHLSYSYFSFIFFQYLFTYLCVSVYMDVWVCSCGRGSMSGCSCVHVWATTKPWVSFILFLRKSHWTQHVDLASCWQGFQGSACLAGVCHCMGSEAGAQVRVSMWTILPNELVLF